MKKIFLLWLIAVISLLTLTACNYQTEQKEEEQLQQEQTTSTVESNNSSENEKVAKGSYVLQADDIAQFPEVPDWKPEEIEEQLEKGYMVPQFLISAYEESGLNGKGMTIQLPSGKQIAKLYVNNNGEYFFDGSYLNGEKAALYRNNNESITILQKIRNSRKLLGYNYENNGNWRGAGVHLDYLDKTEAKLVDYGDDFTIIYYPETNEMVCVRYGEELGPRTKIDPSLLQPGSFSYEWQDGAMRYNNGFKFLTIGFSNEGRLIYPIILKNGEEVSFHLYIATVLDENTEEASKTEIDGIQYGIYQGKAYTVQNAIKRENSDPRGYRLVVEDTEIHLQVKEIEESLPIQETEVPIEEINWISTRTDFSEILLKPVRFYAFSKKWNWQKTTEILQ